MNNHSLREDRRAGFTWFPADWLSDEGVKSVSFAAKGLWIGMICLMFRSPRKGMLLKQTGDVADSNYLANQLGGRAEDIDVLLAELEREQVFSRYENGAIVCRKMWAVTEISEKRAEAGRQGGLAKAKQSDVKQKVAKPSNRRKGEEGIGREGNGSGLYSEDFALFWKAYPRRTGKGGAFRAWEKIKDRPAVEVLVAAVAAQKRSGQWRKQSGQFIPHPQTWLNGRRWEDDVDAEEVDDDGYDPMGDMPFHRAPPRAGDPL